MQIPTPKNNVKKSNTHSTAPSAGRCSRRRKSARTPRACRKCCCCPGADPAGSKRSLITSTNQTKQNKIRRKQFISVHHLPALTKKVSIFKNTFFYCCISGKEKKGKIDCASKLQPERNERKRNLLFFLLYTL